MKFRTLSTLLLGLALALPTLAGAAEPASSAGAARFEALKKLAGDWVQMGPDGKPGETLASSIRVTAGGTVIQETLFPGTDHEMVTLYHLDGASLMLTHYCSLGNQPRMRAVPGADPAKIAFKFVDGTNLGSQEEMHMAEATFQILGPNRFKAVWTANKAGKPCHTTDIDLVRKK